MQDPFAQLAATCRAAGLPWHDAWSAPLQRLAAVLAEHAARTNLVGDPTAAGLCEHVVEALCVAAAAEKALGRAPVRVVDVGAGAGLEALTLALAWPDAKVVALEPRALRHAFIRVAAEATGLVNVEVVGKSLHAAELPPTFELATARAVWPPPQWLARARALLAPGGVVALHGTGTAQAFAAALPTQGWRVAAVRDVPGQRQHGVAVVRPVG